MIIQKPDFRDPKIAPLFLRGQYCDHTVWTGTVPGQYRSVITPSGPGLYRDSNLLLNHPVTRVFVFMLPTMNLLNRLPEHECLLHRNVYPCILNGSITLTFSCNTERHLNRCISIGRFS